MKENSPSDEVTGETPAPSRRMVLQSALGLLALGFESATAAAQRPIAPSVGVVLPLTNGVVSSFRVAIAPEAIEDLRRRLAMTRWPEQETVNDGSQGVQLARAHLAFEGRVCRLKFAPLPSLSKWLDRKRIRRSIE
jgi:hypothetical protein